ncbi:MAG: ATP-binding protein [Roseburia sp.]|nr:ATP-binding protein [Roseburia sp.]
MKLRIQNVAKIKSAELELNGITVITGNNNSGKSTVGKAIFSIYNSLVNVEERITAQKEKLIYQMLIRKAEDLSVQEDGMFSGIRISPVIIRRYANEMTCEVQESGLREIIEEFCQRLRKDSDENVSEIMEEVYRIKNLPEERLIKSAISAYFDSIFNSEINNVYHLDEEAILETEIKGREIRIAFRENSCVELQKQINILNEAIYLDNPFILDCLNNGTNGLEQIERTALNKLRKNTDIMENVVQYNFIEDRMQEVLDKINEVSSGSVQRDEARSYCYKEKNTAVKLNVNNLSAGLKSFVIIKTLLENGALKEKDVLILDEPEIHLHPAWQMVYAEVIVLLQKTFELTIVLTTHSSHFLEALQLYAKKHGVTEKCSYYLSENEDDGCTLKDVSDDITKIYSQLVEPSILLDKLRSELEEAEDD